MTTSFGVIVATRDRPAYVAELLPRIAHDAGAGCLGIALVDDSRRAESRTANAAVVDRVRGAVHLRADEQRRLVDASLGRDAFDLCFRRLGDPEWNCGSSRNTGALYWLTRKERPGVVVFLDDDMEPRRGDWLKAMIDAAAATGGVAGHELAGMPDESRRFRIHRAALRSLGRAVDDGERWTAYPLSGGCVAIFSRIVAEQPFSSVYNEDYFLFFELVARGVPAVPLPRGAVAHRQTDEVITVAKLQSEAVGDITHQAIMLAPESERTIDWLLAHPSAWEAKRHEYAGDLHATRSLCATSPDPAIRVFVGLIDEVEQWLRDFALDLQPFESYVHARRMWRRALASRHDHSLHGQHDVEQRATDGSERG